MKTHHILALSAILLATPAMSQYLTGNHLKIGTTPGSNQGGWGSVIVGTDNILWVYASLGQLHANRSVVIGGSNSIMADDSIITGAYNNSDYSEETDGYTLESAVFGRWNWISADSSLVVGTSNSISRHRTGTGENDWQKPKNAVVLGAGLINRFSNCTIVGKNNISVFPTQVHTGPSPLLVVGNGPTASSRSNALEVLDNGNVTVQGVVTCAPGGDIPMFTGN
jgi:hypothetical protein